jgi:hypothetical protein
LPGRRGGGQTDRGGRRLDEMQPRGDVGERERKRTEVSARQPPSSSRLDAAAGDERRPQGRDEHGTKRGGDDGPRDPRGTATVAATAAGATATATATATVSVSEIASFRGGTPPSPHMYSVMLPACSALLWEIV